MDRDLRASSPPRDDWYEWSLTAFYAAYIAFEWMSLLWKVVPAHVYVSLLVLSWGLTALAAGAVALVPRAHRAARPAGHRRGRLHRHPLLPVLLLQAPRAGLPHGHVHLG